MSAARPLALVEDEEAAEAAREMVASTTVLLWTLVSILSAYPLGVLIGMVIR